MTVKVLRTDGGVAAGVVRAIDPKGSPIGEARYAFAPQDRETEAAFDLPVELRNDIARLEISGERSAGAVQLLDKRWRRRAIGIVSGSTSDTAQPLLASTFYLTRALAPFADVRLGDRGAPQQAITQFLDQKLPMIVLADVGTLSPEIRERISAWIEQGGVLVRFAGPRLAQADDDLVPVEAAPRRTQPRRQSHLGKAAASGLVRGRWTVRRPRGAEGHHRQPAGAGRTGCGAGDQELGLAGRWHAAGHRRASRQGRGQPVSCQRRHALVRSADVRQLRRDAAADRRHVRLHLRRRAPASPAKRARRRWRRCARSTASARSDRRPRPPSRCRADFRDRATPEHPPGFYGPADGPLAVNALAAADRIAPLDTSSLQARRASYTNAEPRDLRGMLLSASLALFLIDAVIVAMLGAGIAALLRRRAVPAALALALALSTVLRRTVAGRGPTATTISPSRRSRKPGSPMSSPAMPTSIPSSRRAWPD